MKRFAATLTYKMWLDGDITEDHFLAALKTKGSINYPKSEQEREQLNNEYQKIQVKQKELFEELLDIEMKELIHVFNKKLERSKDTFRLVKSEIEMIEKLFFPEKLKIEKTCLDNDWIDLGSRHYTVRAIEGTREFYKEHIIDGEPIDYSIVQSPNVKEADVDNKKTLLDSLLFAKSCFDFLNWLNDQKWIDAASGVEKILVGMAFRAEEKKDISPSKFIALLDPTTFNRICKNKKDIDEIIESGKYCYLKYVPYSTPEKYYNREIKSAKKLLEEYQELELNNPESSFKYSHKASTFKSIVELLETKIDTPDTPAKRKPAIPQILDDCFGDGNADTYIDILKKVEPPVINQKGFYNLGEHQKGAITVWVQILRGKGKLQGVTDGVLADLLNKKIPGLNITDRTLRNLGTTYYKKYRTKILALFP